MILKNHLKEQIYTKLEHLEYIIDITYKTKNAKKKQCRNYLHCLVIFLIFFFGRLIYKQELIVTA